MEPVEISAMAASPLTRLFWAIHSIRTDARITIGMATAIGAAFRAVARARAPNPTWDSPSPIME